MLVAYRDVQEWVVPYFSILPAFFILELLLVAGLVGTFLSVSLRPYRPHALQVLIWATLGFLAANASVVVLTVAVVWLESRAHMSESGVVKMLLATLFVPAPFIASVGGLALGALVGVRRALAEVRPGGPTIGCS